MDPPFYTFYKISLNVHQSYMYHVHLKLFWMAIRCWKTIWSFDKTMLQRLHLPELWTSVFSYRLSYCFSISHWYFKYSILWLLLYPKLMKLRLRVYWSQQTVVLSLKFVSQTTSTALKLVKWFSMVCLISWDKVGIGDLFVTISDSFSCNL